MTPFAATIGQGETPALLLHCSLASHQAIVPLANALPDLRCTCMDLLGHGANPAPDGPNDLQTNAAAAQRVWDGPGWVIGHSYGAAVAVRFALNHPDRVTRLVLIEPVLFAAARDSAGYAQFQKDFIPIGDAFDSRDMDAAAQHFMALWGDGTPWSKTPEKLRNYAAKRMPFIAESTGDLEHDRSGIFALGALEQLAMPTILIRGETTHPVISDIHAALARRIPDATQHVVVGAGHMAPISHTADVAAIVQALASAKN